MSYLKKAVTGLYWTLLLRTSLRASSFARTIILARLLTPAQFGVYGIAALTLALLETITETGINVFLIQEKDSDSYINTAWIVSIARGLIIGLLIIAFSKFISSFFNSPEAITPILLISLVAIIRGFINPSEISFQKLLKFNQEFKFRSVLFLIEAVTTIIFAAITHSPSSLIIGLLVSSLVEVVVSLRFIKPVPKFSFDKSKLRAILNRGKWITAAGIFNYFYRNLDNIVIGRLLGVGPLGLYNMAYTVSSLPITEVGDAVSKVTFPIYVQINLERIRLIKAFLKSILVLSAVVIPFGLILYFFPQVLVILLGPKWLPALPALKILALFGIIRSISGSTSALFLAVNKTHFVTWVTLASVIGLGITIVPFVRAWGIVGGSYAAVVGSLVALPVIIYFSYLVFSKHGSTD